MYLRLTELLIDWKDGKHEYHEKDIVVNPNRIVSMRSEKMLGGREVTNIILDNAMISVTEEVDYILDMLGVTA